MHHSCNLRLFSTRFAQSLTVHGVWVLRRMSSGASTSHFGRTRLSLAPPSLEEEAAQFNERITEMAAFFALPRFSALKRPYTPASVASKQGTLPVLPLPSTLLADKLFALLSSAAGEGKPVHTMGAIDPVQMTQMARHQQVVYISGWAASSLLTTGNNEVGPDLGCVQAGPTDSCASWLTRPKRLPLHHRAEPSSPDFPCSAIARQEALRRTDVFLSGTTGEDGIYRLPPSHYR
jgi:hypothetical protein